jgi:hypothetical protein
MVKLKLKPLIIKVSDLDIREKSINCSLSFKGVSDNEEYDFSDSINWKTKFENIELEIHKIITEIKKKTKQRYRENNLNMPEIDFEELKLEKEIKEFFKEAQFKAEQVFVKTDSEGYMQLIDSLKQTERRLDLNK